MLTAGQAAALDLLPSVVLQKLSTLHHGESLGFKYYSSFEPREQANNERE